MRPPVRIAIAIGAVLSVASCGGSESREGPRQRDAVPPRAEAPTAPDGQASAGCAAQGRVALVDAAPTASTRRRVAAAAARAKRTGHRFEQLVHLRSGGLRASARVEGRRLPDGSSTATLTWNGAARLLLPDLDLRIVDDQLYISREDRPGWRAAGSASGIALDVGRELLDHPFLLEPVAARRGAGHLALDLVAPAARLRQYATTERRGPVTDLLAGTRRLTLTAHASGRQLSGDDFALATRIPRSLRLPGLRAGSPLVVAAQSFYCPLRPADRRAISAPADAR